MKKLIQYLIAFLLTFNLFSIFGSASAKEKLKPSDYKMNTAYTYVYDHSEKYIFRKKVGNEYYWKKYLKSEKKYELNDVDLCEHVTSSILEDCSIGGGMIYLKKTIKKGYTWKFIHPIDDLRTVNTMKITNTNATVKTKAKTFKHVVIVKSTSKYGISYKYFAKGYGLIKTKIKNGNEKRYYTNELTQLTKRNSKDAKELKSIKKYAKSGKTPQTRSVKIGDTTNTVKKILGKPKSVDYYRVSGIYNYSNNRSLWFENMKEKYSSAVAFTSKSRVQSIENNLKNKNITYKQIKKVFGKTDYLNFDSLPWEHFIVYKIGKYKVYFNTESEKYKTDQKLKDSIKFISYAVAKDN